MIFFFSFVLVPLATLFVAGEEGWLTANFSVLAGKAPGWYRLVCWGFLTGGFFHFLMRRTIGQAASFLSAKKELVLTDAAVWLLFLSVFLPYRPEILPLLSGLHTALAFFSSALFYLLLFSMGLRCYVRRPREFFPLLAALFLSFPVLVFLFFLSGLVISTALEVFFTLFSSFWLYALHRKVSLSVRREAAGAVKT